MERVLALLIAAHCVADFTLQPDRFVKHERVAFRLILRGLTHAVVAYLFYKCGAFGSFRLQFLAFIS